jgi:hypothetical protein
MYSDVPLEFDIEWVNHAIIYMKDGSKLLSDSYDSYGRFFKGEDLIYHDDDERVSIYHVACEDVDICERYAVVAEVCGGQEFDLEKLIEIQGQYILRRPYVRRDVLVEPTMDMLQPLITCFDKIMESEDDDDDSDDDSEKWTPLRRFENDITNQLFILREKTKELESIQKLSWCMFHVDGYLN